MSQKLSVSSQHSVLNTQSFFALFAAFIFADRSK
jgi:hypothetical protein